MPSCRSSGSDALRLLATALTPVLLFACGGDGGGTSPVDVELVLSPTSLTLFVGETETINATVTGVTGAAVSFQSSDTDVATVDASGQVTAAGVGDATITGTVVGEGVSQTVDVTVQASSVAVDPAAATIEVGQSVQLTATITGGVGLTVGWESSPAGVASVDADGLVTGVTPGEATVTASVNGQPGVSASSVVTVTAPPVVTASTITDAGGGAADLTDVRGPLTFTFEIEGPSGSTGRIDVFVDGAVVASTEFELPAAVGSGGLAVVELGNAVAVVDPQQIERIGETDLAEVIRRGPGVITSSMTSGGTTADVVLRGRGSLAATFNQRPLVLINGQRFPDGSVTRPDGTVVSRGRTDVDLQLFFNRVPPEAIERVEILRDGASALYGSDAVAGVINVVLKPESVPEQEGFRGITEVRGFTASDDQVQVDRGMGDSRFADLGLAPLAEVDTWSPRLLGRLEITGDAAIGRLWNAQADFETGAGFEGWEDRNFDFGRFDAATSAGSWDITDVRLGTDFEGFGVDGLSVRLSAYAQDLVGNQRRETLIQAETGLPADVYVDLTEVDLFLPGDARWIQNDQLGIRPDQRYFLQAVDPPGADGPFAAGVFTSDTWARLECVNESGSEFLVGSVDAVEAIGPDLLTVGWRPDFTLTGACEYGGIFRVSDKLGNFRDVSLRATFGDLFPTVGPITASGTFEGGSDVTFTADVGAAPELHLGAGGIRYDGVLPGGESLYLISGFDVLGLPFDGVFNTSQTYSGTVSGFVPNLETTAGAFPYTPTGSFYQGGYGAVGVVSTANRLGLSGVAIMDQVPDPSGSFLPIDNFQVGAGAPTELCNPRLVTDCGSTPTRGVFRGTGLIPGDGSSGPAIEVESMQAFVQKRLDDGLVVGVPISERVTPTVIDSGSYREFYHDFMVDADALDLSGEVEGLFILGFNGAGDALKARTAPLSVRFVF